MAATTATAGVPGMPQVKCSASVAAHREAGVVLPREEHARTYGDKGLQSEENTVGRDERDPKADFYGSSTSMRNNYR